MLSSIGQGYISDVLVLVSVQDALQLFLQLLEPRHLVGLALVPAGLQRLHLLHYLGGGSVLEVFFVISVHLLCELGLLLLVPFGLGVGIGLRAAEEGETIVFHFLLDPGHLLKLGRHLKVHLLVSHVYLLIHLEVLIIEQFLKLLGGEIPLRVFLFELLAPPLLVDLVDVDRHLVLEDEVADPPLLLLALGVAEGADVGLHLLPEEFAELYQHFLGPVGVIQRGQFESSLSVLYHPVDVVYFGADVVVLDLLSDSH